MYQIKINIWPIMMSVFSFLSLDILAQNPSKLLDLGAADQITMAVKGNKNAYFLINDSILYSCDSSHCVLKRKDGNLILKYQASNSKRIIFKATSKRNNATDFLAYTFITNSLDTLIKDSAMKSRSLSFKTANDNFFMLDFNQNAIDSLRIWKTSGVSSDLKRILSLNDTLGNASLINVDKLEGENYFLNIKINNSSDWRYFLLFNSDSGNYKIMNERSSDYYNMGQYSVVNNALYTNYRSTDSIFVFYAPNKFSFFTIYNLKDNCCPQVMFTEGSSVGFMKSCQGCYPKPYYEYLTTRLLINTTTKAVKSDTIRTWIYSPHYKFYFDSDSFQVYSEEPYKRCESVIYKDRLGNKVTFADYCSNYPCYIRTYKYLVMLNDSVFLYAMDYNGFPNMTPCLFPTNWDQCSKLTVFKAKSNIVTTLCSPNIQFSYDGDVLVMDNKLYFISNKVGNELWIYNLNVETKLTAIDDPDLSSPSLVFYPNPSKSSSVHINLTTSGALFTMEGQKITEIEDSNEMDVSNLCSGFYIFKTSKGKAAKLIIE